YPWCAHVCEALHKVRDTGITGCLGNHRLSHVIKRQPELFQVAPELDHDLSRALQREVHGIALPNKIGGQIKVKIVLSEQIDQVIRHIVARDESHIGLNSMLLKTGLLQL